MLKKFWEFQSITHTYIYLSVSVIVAQDRSDGSYAGRIWESLLTVGGSLAHLYIYIFFGFTLTLTLVFSLQFFLS